MPKNKKPSGEEEKFSPKAASGENFDDLLKRLVRVKPDKPKKASRPKKEK